MRGGGRGREKGRGREGHDVDAAEAGVSSVRAPLASESPTLLSASLTLSFASMALIMPGGSILHKVLMYS